MHDMTACCYQSGADPFACAALHCLLCMQAIAMSSYVTLDWA